MNTKDAIHSCTKLSHMVLKAYISDLEDADLMQRPGEGCNHLAWQLGHLISSEVHLLNQIAPGTGPELPEGFAEAHSKENCGNDEAGNFQSKEKYVELLNQVSAASMSALDAYPDADLDNPSPESFRDFCPTMGDMFILIANHPMMHAGQFAIVRRKLGKPILM